MGEELKKILKKGVKIVMKPIIFIIIGAIILASLFWAVIHGVYTSVSEIFTDIVDNIKISGNNIEIDQDYLQKAKERLKRLGVNSETLGLGNDEEYLERFLEAEIVTNYPYLGGDGLQGTVYFDRSKIDGTTIRLSYISYDEFYNKVNNGEDVDAYFTVDEEDWTVHVMKIDGTIEKINYKNMVEKFSMPFEFPVALALASQNPQFALAVVNLVKDSRIVIRIAESETITTTTVTEHYHKRVTQSTKDGDYEVVSDGEEQGQPQVTTETTQTTDIFLSEARTWILNEITEVTRDDSDEDLEPVESESLGSSMSTAKNDDGTVVTTSITNRRNVTEVHKEYHRWIRGASKVIEKTENFTKLIINDGTTNGNGFVRIAKELHDYLAENDYYYSSEANVTAGKYVRDGEAISSRRPTFGEPMSERYLCCTTFSAWVLETAGYEGIDYRSVSLLNDSIKDRGWILIDDIEDVIPGDICFWYSSGTTTLSHTNVCASKDADGTLRYYDAGCTDSIRAYDPILYLDKMGSIRKFAFAYRPNDEIAKSLGAGNIDELKEDIENYIGTLSEGTYSVGIVNLNKASEKVNINTDRVKSNGFVKLFIMATVYNEIKSGNLDKNEVIADIERMITTDDNTSANSLLTIMGNGDIAKGVDKVNEYARRYSYRNTKLEGEIEQGTATDGNDQTYTNITDVENLLKKIFNGTCVNKEYSTEMLEILKAQIIADMIPSTLTNAEVANKSGEQNGIIQDSAIISTENANYIIVISASDVTNIDYAKTNIKEITNMINIYFEQYGTVEENTNFFDDDEIETKMNGDRVCYRLPSGEFQCPLNNLVEGREMLFELLGQSEKTQNHERLMRYLLYLLTGNDYGVTEFDFNEFLNGSFYGVTGLVGSTPEEKVWWALIDAGYSKEATAGVMGNIYAESGFNSSLIESGYTEENGGIGLCQWTNNERGNTGRNAQLKAYAQSKGVEWKDLNTQIEFLLGELTPGGGANGYATYNLMTNHGYTANDWKNASTPETAAEIFCWIFERPGIPRMEVRTSAARRYYEQFKDAERPASGSNGSLLQAADNVARYLLDNGYTYAGTGYVNYTFPIANSRLRTLSCSSYVQECLLQAGYSQAAGGEKLWARGSNRSAAIADLRSIGINAQVLGSMYEVQPGDIIQFSNGWPGGFHVVIAYSVSGGNIQRKGVAEVMNPSLGNNSSQGAAGFDGKTAPISSYQDSWGCYALRISN